MKRQNTVYYQGQFRNNSSKPQQIRILNTFTQPLLEDPSAFQGRVDEFVIDNTNLPTMVAVPRQDGAVDVDELNYFVALKWNGYEAISWLRLISVNEWDRPETPSPTADIKHQPFYSIVSLQQWLNIVNNALRDAYVELLTFPGYPYPAENTPPFLVLNADTGILALVLPQTFSPPLNTYIVSFVFSRSLQNILKIPYDQILYDTNWEPKPNLAYETTLGSYLYYVRSSVDWLSTTDLVLQFPTTPLWAAPAYYFCTAFDWRGQWCSVKKIVLECNLGRTEQGSSTTSTISDQVEPVLATYTIDLDGAQSINGLSHYTPYYPKIWDVGKQSQVNQIFCNFFWKNEDGRKYPLLATFGSETTIKIAFERYDKIFDENSSKKK